MVVFFSFYRLKIKIQLIHEENTYTLKIIVIMLSQQKYTT
jgi:hypothetical protein